MNPRLYYRRVWQWMNNSWQVAKEGFVRDPLTVPACQFEPPTFCSPSPPFIFERWWFWSPSTIGTGGDWVFAAEDKNWI